LLQQAEIALAALDNGATGSDIAFYTGKVATAQFFARNILPELTATRAILANLDNDIMDLDEAAF
ncbi:acyl-CoA dehydrogenase C-terminal domain-containing protein, partial [Nocardia sp. AG03]|uniref:acyl-CoA dehydrogenase C-terminal domain-containing protein n=1 Tax=Nocardia sp. AG03 TaxID=3025312 RepID=UPI0024184D8D